MELCQAFVDARCARLVNKKAAASSRELMHHAYVFQQIIPTSVGAKCANRRYPSAAKKNPAHDARRVLPCSVKLKPGFVAPAADAPQVAPHQ
jgi:hypothetical protein